MPNLTVSDAGCLILFSKIGELELLKHVFNTIDITEPVTREFNRPLPEWINVIHTFSTRHSEIVIDLDAGEASSILLAAEQSGTLLIIDKTKGRRIARNIGIRITGSMGVLVAAKNAGYIQSVTPIIEKIERTNFRITKELIQKVLKTVNEI